MPYRRLPNTDSARIKALKTAHHKGSELPPFKLAYSQGMYQKVKTILPNFETAMHEHRNSMELHAEKNREYQKRVKKARLYISHFIQVVDMAITRGEMPQETRTFYGLNHDEKKLPSLTNEEDIYTWGKKLIDGEKARRAKGKGPVTNPTIAVVKVHYDKFVDAYNHQKSLKKRSSHAHDNLMEIRNRVDEIIQQTWNEVEDTFKDLPEEIRREKSADYGVVYVYRKNELSGVNLFQPSRVERFG